jgi:predicted metal-dependent HD superfamily phosphohydrolase
MSDGALRERFGRLWRRMGAVDDGGPIADELLRAYGEPLRRYHGRKHLLDCLNQLDAAPAGEAERDFAETALWFHDAVYVPGAVDNEARSADWAAEAMRGAGIPEDRSREVVRLIHLTDHAVPPTDPVGALVCDVDLSILGRGQAEFGEYERRIREEYRDVPERLYCRGRAAVLSRLLARDPLYQLPHFRSRYESAARRNLTESLDRLMQGSQAE